MANFVPGQVKKRLNAITLLCMAFVICNSWAGVAGSLQLALLAGGPSTLVYSILVTTTAYFSIAASMAELAAVYPTAGGQYHFASILAPKRWRRGLSYSCGLLALFSWLVIGVSVTSIATQQLLALVSTSLSDFAPEHWHIFLVYQGFALFSTLYNAFILKRNSWTHNVACRY
jgi:choline transport protein